jgi:hypothetical protein
VNLAAIRRGVATVLSGIDGVRIFDAIPEALAASGVTALVIAPGDTYVTYSEGAGLTNRNEVRLRVIVVPPQQAGAARIMAEIDELLSCGADMPRSIRTTLGGDISADGTACSVSTISADVRTITINEFSNVVGEVDLRIMARC